MTTLLFPIVRSSLRADNPWPWQEMHAVNTMLMRAANDMRSQSPMILPTLTVLCAACGPEIEDLYAEAIHAYRSQVVGGIWMTWGLDAAMMESLASAMSAFYHFPTASLAIDDALHKALSSSEHDVPDTHHLAEWIIGQLDPTLLHTQSIAALTHDWRFDIELFIRSALLDEINALHQSGG